jgi:hypothetical protein
VIDGRRGGIEGVIVAMVVDPHGQCCGRETGGCVEAVGGGAGGGGLGCGLLCNSVKHL